MDNKITALRELRVLIDNCPEYSLGEIFYSAFRHIPETSGLARVLRDLKTEDIYNSIQKAVEEEVESDYF